MVGLFILVTIGVVVGVMVRTSGFLERRYELYLRTATAEGVSQDTRIYLQGLPVGRVTRVLPALDSATGRLGFVVTLSMDHEFPDGSPLRLPRGTRGVITQPSIVGGHIVALEMPTGRPAGDYLEPGDTLDSRRVESVVSVLNDMATRLTNDISASLQQTRELMARANQAVSASTTLLRAAGPDVEQVLQQLALSLDRTDSIMRALEPQVVTIADTLLTTLSETRAVLARFDTLASTANAIATDNRGVITETLERLQRSAVILEHFSDQLSRRPLRLLTGVTPPAVDSTERKP